MRSGWRAAVFLSVFIFLELGWVSLVGILMPTSSIEGERGSLFLWGTDIFVSLILAIVLGWVVGKKLEGLPLKALGWTFHRGWFFHGVVGLIWGAGELALACLICVLLGGMSFQWNNEAGPAAITNTLLISLAMFLVGAASEESLFRGYLMQTFARAKLAWVAIVITSLFFASAHLANPNTSILALINTVLAGVWFSVAYLKTRSLWLPFTSHFAWNWFQGAILGIPVSGITRITIAPLLQHVDNGPAWLTGGSYGIEGGIACTIAIVVSTTLLWFVPFLKADKEMLELTNSEKILVISD